MNRSVKPLRVLKPEQCDFLGQNRYGAGAVQTIDSTLVLLLRGTVNSALKILQNGSKYHFGGKRTTNYHKKDNTKFI